MVKCDTCRKELQLPFKCNYCGRAHCSEHYIPESHHCMNAPREAPWHIKQALEQMEKLQKLPLPPKTVPAQSMLNEEARCSSMRGKWFPIGKVIGVSVAVLVIGAFIWYASPTILNALSLFNPQRVTSKNESFLLPASHIFTPVNISRSISLHSGEILVGNFTISGVPHSGTFYPCFLTTAILDPQSNVLALYGTPSDSFRMPATTDGSYVISFVCTTTYTSYLPATLNVTLSYNIIG